MEGKEEVGGLLFLSPEDRGPQRLLRGEPDNEESERLQWEEALRTVEGVMALNSGTVYATGSNHMIGADGDPLKLLPVDEYVGKCPSAGLASDLPGAYEQNAALDVAARSTTVCVQVSGSPMCRSEGDGAGERASIVVSLEGEEILQPMKNDIVRTFLLGTFASCNGNLARRACTCLQNRSPPRLDCENRSPPRPLRNRSPPTQRNPATPPRICSLVRHAPRNCSLVSFQGCRLFHPH
jgi:hypothetical protein